MVSVTATWNGSYPRAPQTYAPGPPSITPLAVPVSNTAGQWLFALVSWRQDAGIAGDLQYPSTAAVSDDAHNFWIPVYSGVPAQAPSSSPVTGVVRCAVWMAPAARAAEYVFVSPTAYQSSLTVLIAEIPAACPWYQVQAVNGSFTNQGGSVTLSQTIPSGVFALGMMAWDNTSGSVTPTATGWTSLATVTTSNGIDHTGDLKQEAWYVTGSGASLTLSATGTPTMDWADVIVVISGVADTRAFPYSLPLENWPVLITEIASGPALNQDPVFAQGTTFWTGSGAAVAGVSWPLFQPVPSSYQTVLYGSLQVTPSGAAATATAESETEAVSPVAQYTALAWVYSAPGFGGASASAGAYAGITWLTSGLSVISTTPGPVTDLPPGEWTQLSLNPVFPPGNAAFGAVVVTQTAGTGKVPASAGFTVGYASFSAADAYEAVPPDQLAWTDVSTRNFTQGDFEISRGIQYENNSLEAGTMTVYLADQDAAITFGNVASPFWPNIGDTDVPVRMRAITPASLTPYEVLFSGFTDDVKYGWDTSEETWYAYAEVTASDAWSRLTQQMVALISQECLLDNPVAVIPCSSTGANIIAGGEFSTTPAVPILFSAQDIPLPATPPTQSFSGGAISLPGGQGLSCWQSAGNLAANAEGAVGWALAWQPAAATLPLTGGITVEFWYSPVSDSANQPQNNMTVCDALTAAGITVWQLFVSNINETTGGAQLASQTFLYLFAFNTDGSVSGPTQVGNAIPFFASDFATQSYYIVVTFSQSSITVTVNPGGTPTETLTVTGLTLSSACTGFYWGGNQGFGDTAIADISIYTSLVPPARSAAHYQAGLTAFASEPDTWRLARVAAYSGFLPVLGMRGLDLPAVQSADVDLVTGATDTNTQVVSAYFTNITSSTLAAMFMDGPGTLIYRRRNEWYDRPVGQYVTGENDSQSLSLGINPLSASFSAAGWTTGNGAALTSSSGAAAAGASFNPSAGLFAGNGSTANPFIITTGNPIVTPGSYYQFSVWLYSAQGWTTSGVTAQIQFYNASNALLQTVSGPAVLIAAGSVAWTTAGPARAPAGAAYLNVAVQAAGTPPGTTGFYVAQAQVSLVTPDYAGGAGCVIPEAPYLPEAQMSSDRAQLFNYAVLTQYGTSLISSFSGTSVLFTPSSGVIVIITNVPSVALRGQVPYTATVYLNNTVQALPYYLDDGSIEDMANWITQTLGSPLFRPEQITLTPAATPSALTTGLQAEVGDTVMFRRRPMGAPEVQIQTYYSKLTHTGNKDTGKWTTEIEESPFPQGSILTTDDVVHGVLTGDNLLGW